MKSAQKGIAVLLTAAALTAVALTLPGGLAAEPAGDLDEAWQQIKKLAGTWDSHMVGRDGPSARISYHVTSDGSVVFEEFLGKTPDGVRSMATAYHRDVEDLVATHYCGAGNQPRMRAVSWDAEAREVRFDFWDITHLSDPEAYYTREIVLYFADDDHAELRFRGVEAGEQLDWQVHRMERLTSRPYESDDEGG